MHALTRRRQRESLGGGRRRHCRTASIIFQFCHCMECPLLCLPHSLFLTPSPRPSPPPQAAREAKEAKRQAELRLQVCARVPVCARMHLCRVRVHPSRCISAKKPFRARRYSHHARRYQRKQVNVVSNIMNIYIYIYIASLGIHSTSCFVPFRA
jgi:hypothetical protein